MDKRVVAAAGVSVLILLGWSYLFPPPTPAPRPAPAIAVHSDDSTPDASQDARAEVSAGAAAPVAEAVGAAEPEEQRIANGLFEVVLTNRGARALSWKLLGDYTTTAGDPLELIPQLSKEGGRTLTVQFDDADLTTLLNEALYQVERSVVPEGERLLYTWSDGQGLVATKSLVFRRNTFLVDIGLSVTRQGRALPARLVLGPGFGAQEPGAHSSYYFESQIVWNGREGVKRVSARKAKSETGGLTDQVRWAGLEDQYFAALLLPGAGPSTVKWEPVPSVMSPAEASSPAGEPVDRPLVSVSIPETGAQLFVGPKKYTLLRELGLELDRVVWFASYAPLAAIAKFLFLGLLRIHDHTIHNYGVAIILATFLLRLLLFPINQYSMVSLKKTQIEMQRLQPKLKAIQAKQKKAKDAESRARTQQEIMDLYRREGVNPVGGLSGCLPMLAQFPILIGFYNMITVAVELRGAPFFGWITDLSQKDPYWVTPLLMGGTLFFQQRMAMGQVKDPVQAQQQKIMMFMPIVFTYICLQMPSGMVLYWFINNLLGIGQQWLVNRRTADLTTAAQKA